jgi:hypothetical protein
MLIKAHRRQTWSQNFQSFINLLFMQLPLQQSINNKNIRVSCKCYSHAIRTARRVVQLAAA